MSLEMKELIKIIDTIRRRLWRNAFFTNLLKGMIAGSFAGFFLNCVALFYPILWQGKKVIFLFLCSEIVCLVYGIFQLPNRKKTAQIGDSSGLKERLTTAYENREKDDFFSHLQRLDALEKSQQVDWKKELCFSYPKKHIYILVVACLLCGISYGIPSKAKEQAIEQQEVVKEVTKIKQEIQKVKEQLQKQKDEELEKVVEELIQTQKELKEVKNKKELEKEKQRLLKKLEQKSGLLKEKEEAKQQIKQLEEGLKSKEETSENGEGETADSANQNGDKTTGEGRGTSSTGSQNGNIGTTNGNSHSSSSGNQNSSIGSTDGNNQNSNRGSQNSNTGSTKGNNQSSNTGSQNGANQSNGGSGSGSGQGQGQGQGSSNKGSGSGSGWNYGGKYGEEEEAKQDGSMIWVPKSVGDDKELTGKENENGSSNKESVLQSEIQAGSHKEYEEVLGEYQDEAYKKIDKKQYSSQANQLIKKYFEQLNE